MRNIAAHKQSWNFAGKTLENERARKEENRPGTKRIGAYLILTPPKFLVKRGE